MKGVDQVLNDQSLGDGASSGRWKDIAMLACLHCAGMVRAGIKWLFSHFAMLCASMKG